MNPPSARARKRRTSQRALLDLAPRRRSSRIQAAQRSRTPPKQNLHLPLPSSAIQAPKPPLPQVRNHRKRGADIPVDIGPEPPLKRARLTKENLKVLERMTGGKRSNDPSSSKTTTASETKTVRSKRTTSTTDSAFQDIAYQNGILNPMLSKPPANLQCHQERIERSRETASPSEEDYRKFAVAIERAPNEATLKNKTSTLLQWYDDNGYQSCQDQAFTSFPKDVGLNNDLSVPKPDFVEGFDMSEFRPFPVRQQLGGAAVLYPGLQATTLPHIAGEFKGPGKSMITARTQAAYDGACMVYGRNIARSYIENPDPPEHAFVSTFTTDGTNLHTFAHYASESNGKVEYHQYSTSSCQVISSYEEFKKARRRIRNLQDYAKETSEQLKDELKAKWLSKQPLLAQNDPAQEDPETNDQYSSVQVPASDGHAPMYTSLPPNTQGAAAVITPPRSSKRVSLPQEPEETTDVANVCGHRRTRRTRTRAVEDVEEAGNVEGIPNARKSRRKRYV